MGNSKAIIKKTGENHPDETIFRLFGDNEPVLTDVLAYLLAANQTFCFEVIRPFVTKKLPLCFNDLEISRQRVASETTSKARTDIEIINPWNFHIVFEAKIGDAVPSIRQCREYVNRFKRCQRKEAHKLILLVNDRAKGDRVKRDYMNRMPSLGGYLAILSWGDIQKIVLRLLGKDVFKDEEKTYFVDFWNFLNRSYYMKSFEQEVMIVGINDTFRYRSNAHSKLRGATSAEAVFKSGMYAGKEAKIKTVLYLAFRYRGKLSHVARVKEQRMKNGQMIFFVDKSLELPIKRSVPYAYRQGVQHSNMQKLLDPDIVDYKDLIEKL